MKGYPKVSVSKLGSLKKGGAILREKLRPEGAAVCLYGDIYTKYAEVVTSFLSRVDPSAVTDGVRINTGDVVFAGSGETAEEIGKCIAYVGNEEAYAGGDVVILSNHGQDARYLGYALNADDAIRQKMRLGQGSSVMHLYKDDVGSIRIPLPPLAEQRKIAEILRTWDEAIETAEAELKAKKERKRWLMEKLLAPALGHGQQGWRSVELGDCFSERSERGQPGLPLLSITGEYGVVDRELIGRRDTSAADKGKYLRIYPGDIGYNTMRMWQGVCGLSNQDGIVSPAYTILRPLPGTNAAFMYYLFKYPAMIAKFHSRSQGLVKDTLNLKFPAFSKISVNQPDSNLQRHIVSVLEKADLELSFSEKYMEALRTQKRGLMQKLLTGEVRVAA
jgi:type I restriction enzyme, S subunit